VARCLNGVCRTLIYWGIAFVRRWNHVGENMFNDDVDTRRLFLDLACAFLFWLACPSGRPVPPPHITTISSFHFGIAILFQSEGAKSYFACEVQDLESWGGQALRGRNEQLIGI
jgi:hypothetical protein